jgi:hypothetical protein
MLKQRLELYLCKTVSTLLAVLRALDKQPSKLEVAANPSPAKTENKGIVFCKCRIKDS